MEAIKILSEIRARECSILGLYKQLAEENLAAAAAGLNVSFDSARLLRDAPAKLPENIKASFKANASTIFSLAVKKFTVNPRKVQDELVNQTIREIRASERKILLDLRDIAIQDPSIAAGCCGLTFEQIDSLRSITASELIEFSYIAHASGQLLKIKFNRDKAFAELVQVGKKPCFAHFGFLMDRAAC